MTEKNEAPASTPVLLATDDRDKSEGQLEQPDHISSSDALQVLRTASTLLILIRQDYRSVSDKNAQLDLVISYIDDHLPSERDDSIPW